MGLPESQDRKSLQRRTLDGKGLRLLVISYRVPRVLLIRRLADIGEQEAHRGAGELLHLLLLEQDELLDRGLLYQRGQEAIIAGLPARARGPIVRRLRRAR